jgi:hypothetical protein
LKFSKYFAQLFQKAKEAKGAQTAKEAQIRIKPLA